MALAMVSMPQYTLLQNVGGKGFFQVFIHSCASIPPIWYLGDSSRDPMYTTKRSSHVLVLVHTSCWGVGHK
jgi:hypothetical protein